MSYMTRLSHQYYTGSCISGLRPPLSPVNWAGLNILCTIRDWGGPSATLIAMTSDSHTQTYYLSVSYNQYLNTHYLPETFK